MQPNILNRPMEGLKGISLTRAEGGSGFISHTNGSYDCLATCFLSIVLALLCLLIFHSPLLAQDEARIHETQYASINYADEKDLITFTMNIGTGLGFFRERPENDPFLTKARLDKIVETVCTILEMHPLNLHFKIILSKTQAGVTSLFRVLGIQGTGPIAFYSHSTRMIIVAIDNITDHILAHEIAHAVLCGYFGAPPPGRMQEVLAQYVDKHLWDN
jgi:hypothetical protein